MNATSVARVDPGPVYKLFYVSVNGALCSPVRNTVFARSPLLRADSFCGSSQVADAPGIHAFRWGACATPRDWYTAIAVCRIPPGCRAVMSPWAVRAERLLIERIRIHASLELAPEWLECIRSRWARHCDIELVPDSAYTAAAHSLVFELEGRSALCAYAGELRIRIRRREWRINAVDDGVVIRAWRRGSSRKRRGPEITRRIERHIRRAYAAGDADMRDILTPWLRYFDYLR